VILAGPLSCFFLQGYVGKNRSFFWIAFFPALMIFFCLERLYRSSGQNNSPQGQTPSFFRPFLPTKGPGSLRVTLLLPSRPTRNSMLPEVFLMDDQGPHDPLRRNATAFFFLPPPPCLSPFLPPGYEL